MAAEKAHRGSFSMSKLTLIWLKDKKAKSRASINDASQLKLKQGERVFNHPPLFPQLQSMPGRGLNFCKPSSNHFEC